MEHQQIALYGCMLSFINMYRPCNSCSKDFDEPTRVRYLSTTIATIGLLFFCSDVCCKNYLTKNP